MRGGWVHRVERSRGCGLGAEEKEVGENFWASRHTASRDQEHGLKCGGSSSLTGFDLLDDEKAQPSLVAQASHGFEAASLDAKVHESLHESASSIEGKVRGFGFFSFMGGGQVDFDGNLLKMGHGAQDECDLTQNDVAQAAVRLIHGIDRGRKNEAVAADARMPRTSGFFSVVIGRCRFRGACVEFVHGAIIIPIRTTCRFWIFSSRACLVWTGIDGIFDTVAVDILERTSMTTRLLRSRASFVGAGVIFIWDAIEVTIAIASGWFRGGGGCGFGDEAQMGEGAKSGSARGAAGTPTKAQGQMQGTGLVAYRTHVFQDGLSSEVRVLVHGASPDLGTKPGACGEHGEVGGASPADALAGLFRGEQGRSEQRTAMTHVVSAARKACQRLEAEASIGHEVLFVPGRSPQTDSGDVAEMVGEGTPDQGPESKVPDGPASGRIERVTCCGLGFS